MPGGIRGLGGHRPWAPTSDRTDSTAGCLVLWLPPAYERHKAARTGLRRVTRAKPCMCPGPTRCLSSRVTSERAGGPARARWTVTWLIRGSWLGQTAQPSASIYCNDAVGGGGTPGPWNDACGHRNDRTWTSHPQGTWGVHRPRTHLLLGWRPQRDLRAHLGCTRFHRHLTK